MAILMERGDMVILRERGDTTILMERGRGCTKGNG